VTTTYDKSQHCNYTPSLYPNACSGEDGWSARTQTNPAAGGKVLGRLQPRPQPLEGGRQPAEFSQMSLGQLAQNGVSPGCGTHPHDPPVGRVGSPADDPRADRPVDELDHAVVAQEQVFREIAHRWAPPVRVAAYREEELVLGTGQPRRLGLLLTPPLEATQAGPEAEEPGIVLIGDGQQPSPGAADVWPGFRQKAPPWLEKPAFLSCYDGPVKS